jgi:hypothetical protein
VVDSCEHDNEPWGSIRDGKFLDLLSDYWFLKKDRSPWSKFISWRCK